MRRRLAPCAGLFCMSVDERATDEDAIFVGVVPTGVRRSIKFERVHDEHTVPVFAAMFGSQKNFRALSISSVHLPVDLKKRLPGSPKSRYCRSQP
jgi:hypothetical protein